MQSQVRGRKHRVVHTIIYYKHYKKKKRITKLKIYNVKNIFYDHKKNKQINTLTSEARRRPFSMVNTKHYTQGSTNTLTSLRQ